MIHILDITSHVERRASLFSTNAVCLPLLPVADDIDVTSGACEGRKVAVWENCTLHVDSRNENRLCTVPYTGLARDVFCTQQPDSRLLPPAVCNRPISAQLNKKKTQNGIFANTGALCSRKVEVSLMD